MKKRNRNIIWTIVGIALAVYIANAYGLIDIRGLTVGVGTQIIDEGTSPASYTCPQGSSFCRVKGVMECNIPKGDSRVVFRTNIPYEQVDSRRVDDYRDRWIAIDGDGDGDMDSFLSDGFTSTCGGIGYTLLKRWSDTTFYFRNGRVCSTLGNRIFESSPGADLSITPKEPYTSNKQELIEGEVNAFKCEGEFIMPGAILPLSYSSSVAGTDETGFKTIQPNEKVEILGGDDNFISWQVIQETETCTGQFYCNAEKTGFFRCEAGIPTDDFTQCNLNVGEKCTDEGDTAKCELPFLNINTETVVGTTPDTPIDIFVDVISEDISGGTVTLKVIKDVADETKSATHTETRSVSFKSGVSEKFVVPGISFIGEYFVILIIDYQGLPQQIVYGDDLDERTSFRVSSSINAIMKNPTQTLEGIPTSVKAFTGFPVVAQMLVTNPDGSPAEPDSFNVKVTIAGVDISGMNQINTFESDNGFVIESQITSASSGILKFEGTATKSGFTTPLTASEIPVEKNNVVIDVVHVPENIELGTSYTFQYETKDSNGNLIDTTNIITMQIKGVKTDITDRLLTTGVGKYKLDFNFDQIGDYQLIIDSQRGGLDSAKFTSSLINVAEDVVIVTECDENDDCAFYQQCRGGKCENNVGLILSLGILSVGIIILVFLVFRFIRKRRDSKINI